VSLPQVECPDCHEMHLLWRGNMAVHTTAAGDRCDGKINSPKPPPRTRPTASEWREVRSKNPERQAAYDAAASGRKGRRVREPLELPVPPAFRRKPKARAKDPNRVIIPITEREPQKPLSPAAQKSLAKAMKNMDKAIDRDRRKRADPLFGLRRETKPIDRRIYQVNGARPVSGGLPSLGKDR
jgi:hypothetical protein